MNTPYGKPSLNKEKIKAINRNNKRKIGSIYIAKARATSNGGSKSDAIGRLFD